MVDSVYRTRSLGVGSAGLPDQYADGKAARIWELYIGSRNDRTDTYKKWLVEILRDNGCRRILDVACGTGIDSIMLLEQGFEVVSSDASDKMLKYALKERWNRRKEDAFDKWEIEEANWLTLSQELEGFGKFDAVLCLGNSFAHLPDFEGTQEKQKLALANFQTMIKPGGILLVDHRNYDTILDSGNVSQGKNVYYKGDSTKDIQTSLLYVNGRPHMVTLDYTIDVGKAFKEIQESDTIHKHYHEKKLAMDAIQEHYSKFRLSYYPHRLNAFTELLKGVFGASCKHSIFGDFKPSGEIENPVYYIHMLQKDK